MSEAVDLSTTFVHLRDGGDAEPVELTRSFWRDSTTPGRYDRIVGAFDFSTPEHLHSSTQEMHPEGDELIFLVEGAIDVILDDDGPERAISLEPGEAAIVPRGVWHRLVMRRPGKLLFVNSRTGMESRPA